VATRLDDSASTSVATAAMSSTGTDRKETAPPRARRGISRGVSACTGLVSAVAS
jgi:hypothetical protein